MAKTPTPILLLILAAGFALVGCSPPEERAAAYLAQAQQFFDAGDYDRAKLEAKNAVQVEPKNAQARYLLALIAEQDEDPRSQVDARGDHRGGVDESADRRGALHGVREPDVQRELG